MQIIVLLAHMVVSLWLSSPYFAMAMNARYNFTGSKLFRQCRHQPSSAGVSLLTSCASSSIMVRRWPLIDTYILGDGLVVVICVSNTKGRQSDRLLLFFDITWDLQLMSRMGWSIFDISGEQGRVNFLTSALQLPDTMRSNAFFRGLVFLLLSNIILSFQATSLWNSNLPIHDKTSREWTQTLHGITNGICIATKGEKIETVRRRC